MKAKKIFMFLQIALFSVLSTSATIRYVKQGGSGTGDGSSWENASDDLQAMITASASSGDLVFVAAGTYTPTSGTAFSIGAKSLGIYGGFAGNETELIPPVIPDTINNKTILQGNGNTVIDASNGSVNLTIQGFRIQGGSAAGAGGGINLYRGEISYCTIIDNTSSSGGGGGAYIQYGSIRNSIVAGNNAGSSNGGGIYLYQNGEVTDCIIKNNSTTGPGGGIKMRVNNSNGIYMNNCLVLGNSGGDGGGIVAESGDGTTKILRIENCIIKNNTASGNGGGVFLNKSKLINSLVEENNITGTGKGGGIRIDGGTGTTYLAFVYNCTVVNNTANAANVGGGISNRSNTASIFSNCIIWGNSANSISNDCENQNGAFFSIYSNATMPNSNGNLSSDPSFINSVGNNFRLADSSPAKDAGRNSDITGYSSDIDGYSRIYNSTVDMGAYEYAPHRLTFTGNGSWSETSKWSTGTTPTMTDSVTIVGDVTIDNDVTISNLSIDSQTGVTVNAGVQLTVTGDIINKGSLTLKSDVTNGTATILTPAAASIKANVEQYLSTTGGRVWYYLSTPAVGAKSSILGEGDKFGYFDETITNYTDPLETGTPFTTGEGYVIKLDASASNPTYTFSGILNNGDISVPITRTGTSAIKRGFNLVGNPYPSYLNWDNVDKTNVESTIWTRTFENGQMVFKTYNADAQVGTDDLTTANIAPLQAFWVKVPEAKGEGTFSLQFDNSLRLHKTESDANLRVPKLENRPIVRLQISNGTNSDQAVILVDSRAENSYERFDSEKMSNENANIPEIYTISNGNKLSINSLKNHVEPIPLGVKLSGNGKYSIKLNSLRNIEAITLIDNVENIQFDLTSGEPYEFISSAIDNTTRFSILFRAQEVNTELESIAIQNHVYTKNNQITIIQKSETHNSKVIIFNMFGQKLYEQTLKDKISVIAQKFDTGIYIVNIGDEIRKVIVK